MAMRGSDDHQLSARVKFSIYSTRERVSGSSRVGRTGRLGNPAESQDVVTRQERGFGMQEDKDKSVFNIPNVGGRSFGALTCSRTE